MRQIRSTSLSRHLTKSLYKLTAICIFPTRLDLQNRRLKWFTSSCQSINICVSTYNAVRDGVKILHIFVGNQVIRLLMCASHSIIYADLQDSKLPSGSRSLPHDVQPVVLCSLLHQTVLIRMLSSAGRSTPEMELGLDL